MTKRAKPKGDCCPLLPMVLGRAKDADKLGLKRELVFSGAPIKPSEPLVIRFRGDRRGIHGAAIVNYCPFCGAKLRKDAP